MSGSFGNREFFRVSKETRQNILDGLSLEQVSWAGRLDEVEFLSRIFDLESLPSFDGRFKTAAGDIWQHRINNFDWEDDWVFRDSRFNLANGDVEDFLKFLCELLHPVVRPTQEETHKLVEQINDQLKNDGLTLVEHERIAGRPRYVPKAIQSSGTRAVSRGREVAEALNAGWMQKEIERVEAAVDVDPALAIGTAKELVESCCKTILTQLGVDYAKSADLPELTKLLSTELRLVPNGIPDQARGAETIKLILRNLAALTKYVAELRGMYGSGHGRSGEHRGLKPRHARLAVGAAVTFIDFVTETYKERMQDLSSSA